MANIYVGGMIWCDLHWSNKVDISFCYESQTISDSVLISLHYLDSIFNQTYHYLISYILHSPFPLNLTNRKNDSITFCTSCYGIIFCVCETYISYLFILSILFPIPNSILLCSQPSILMYLNPSNSASWYFSPICDSVKKCIFYFAWMNFKNNIYINIILSTIFFILLNMMILSSTYCSM